jgi:molybdopterin synthase sulfur carrier subunit
VLTADNELQGVWQHADAAFGQGDTLGHGLITHIHHVGFTCGIEVRQSGRVISHNFACEFSKKSSETKYTLSTAANTPDPALNARKPSMSITVKFFASLRESLDKSEAILDTTDIRTAKDAWQAATENHDPLPNMLVAINMEYANLDAAVKDGDEVAFFPPVTGG